MTDFSDTPAAFSLSVRTKAGDAPPLHGAGLNGALTATGSQVPWRDVMVQFANQDGAGSKPFSPSVTLSNTTVSLQGVASNLFAEFYYPENQTLENPDSAIPAFTLHPYGNDTKGAATAIAGRVTISRPNEFIANITDIVSVNLDTRSQSNTGTSSGANALTFGPRGGVDVHFLGADSAQFVASAPSATLTGTIAMARCGGDTHIGLESQSANPFNIFYAKGGTKAVEVKNAKSATIDTSDDNATIGFVAIEGGGAFYLDQGAFSGPTNNGPAPGCPDGESKPPSKFELKNVQVLNFISNNEGVNNTWQMAQDGQIDESLAGEATVHIRPCHRVSNPLGLDEYHYDEPPHDYDCTNVRILDNILAGFITCEGMHPILRNGGHIKTCHRHFALTTLGTNTAPAMVAQILQL